MRSGCFWEWMILLSAYNRVWINFFLFLLFESFNDVEELSCYWQEDGGSVLTNRFMTIVGQKHTVLKLSKSVFIVFVKNQNTEFGR